MYPAAQTHDIIVFFRVLIRFVTESFLNGKILCKPHNTMHNDTIQIQYQLDQQEATLGPVNLSIV